MLGSSGYAEPFLASSGDLRELVLVGDAVQYIYGHV